MSRRLRARDHALGLVLVASAIALTGCDSATTPAAPAVSASTAAASAAPAASSGVAATLRREARATLSFFHHEERVRGVTKKQLLDSIEGETFTTSNFLGGDPSSPGWDLHDMWVDPMDGDRSIVVGDGGVAITANRMASWYRVQLPLAQMYHVTVDNAVPYNVLGPLDLLVVARHRKTALLGDLDAVLLDDLGIDQDVRRVFLR